MSGALVIARHELLRLLRDRVLLVFGVGLPALIMLLVGSTFGGAGTIEIGVLDRDGSPASRAVVERLEAIDGVDVQIYEQETTLRRDVRTTARQAGLVVPKGYGEDVADGRGRIDLVIDPTSAAVATAVATINGAVAREAVVAGAVELVGDDDAVDYAAAAVRPIEVVATGESSDGPVGLGSFSYTAPANLVLFVFTNTFVVSSILANDRKKGLTRRMLAAPVTVGTVALGIGAAKVAFALVQSAVLLGVGTVLFGVEWGDPIGAALVILLFSVVAAAIGLLVGAKVGDADQAQSIGIPISVAAGMLGGCMWPLDIVPSAMRIVGHVVPHAWAMDAWRALIFDGEGVAGILPQLGVLAAMALVFGGLAARGLRRAVVG